MSKRGWLLFLALGIIWGLPYLLIRIAVREVSPAFLVLVRTGGGALLMAPFFARRGVLRPLLGYWKPIVAYSVVEIAIPWWLLFTAEKRVSSSVSGLLVSMVPIASAIIARVTGSERIGTRRLVGLGSGIAGAAALVGFGLGGSSLWATSSFLVIVTGYALGPWILSRNLSELPGPSVVLASLVLCAVIYIPLAAKNLPAHALSAEVLLSIVGLTVVCTVMAFTVFFALIQEVGAMRATVVTYVNPAVAVLLGVTLLGESFGPWRAVGFVTVLGGSFLATRPGRVTVAAAPGVAAPEPLPAGPLAGEAVPGQQLAGQPEGLSGV